MTMTVHPGAVAADGEATTTITAFPALRALPTIGTARSIAKAAPGPEPKGERGISVFFPCFNDAGTIPSMVMEALTVLRGLTRTYEVIVIENGSTDYAWDVLDELDRLYGPNGADAQERGRVRVIRYGEALDYGGALRAGFAACRYPLIFYTDGDGQYDVRELRALYTAMELEEGAGRPVDVVMGNKITRRDPLHRRFISWAYHHSMSFVFQFKVHDVDCDFRLIRAAKLDQIHLEHSSGVICVELVKKLQDAGARFVEVPIHHYPRLHGQSQFFKLSAVAGSLKDLALLWFRLVVFRKRG